MIYNGIMKITQKEIIIKYIEANGSIIPAKCANKEWNGYWMGAELSKRCRELRKIGTIISEPDGKYEKFYFPGQINLI
jgi:hypothetical protein